MNQFNEQKDVQDMFRVHFSPPIEICLLCKPPNYIVKKLLGVRLIFVYFVVNRKS